MTPSKNPALSAGKRVNIKYVVEPDDFEIMADSSSRDADLQKVILTVKR